MTLKVGESIARSRQVGASIANLESYFDLLERTLHENDLIHRPCQIFNTDETGVPLDAKPLKVYGTVTQKNFYSVTTGNKKQITVLACTSAGGTCLPPMIVFNRRGLGEGMDEGTVPGTYFAFSPNGWIDTELFETWFFSSLSFVCSSCETTFIINGRTFQPLQSQFHKQSSRRANNSILSSTK